MKIDYVPDLAPDRSAAVAKIDDAAEAMRGNFITKGSGQAMVYQQKKLEAEMFMANNEIADNAIPHIVAEAALNGYTKYQQAYIVLYMADQWKFISTVIESKRLLAKNHVAEAGNAAAIQAATVLDWSDLAPYLP